MEYIDKQLIIRQLIVNLATDPNEAPSVGLYFTENWLKYYILFSEISKMEIQKLCTHMLYSKYIFSIKRTSGQL